MSGPPIAGAPRDPQAGPAPLSPRVLVVDASVGVKWYVPEAHATEARRLLDARFRLHVPDYFFIEAASVLQRKVAVDRTLTESEGWDIFDLLRAAPVISHPTAPLLEAAFRLGVRLRRPVYDSLYLVLAQALGGPLVTADRRLYNGVHGGPLDHLALWVSDPL